MRSDGIFLGYRRGEDAIEALYLHLIRAFGSDAIFRDEASIPPGAQFEDCLTDKIGGCRVFLAVIGPGWLQSVEKLGAPNDWVRREIEIAIESGIQLVPVLLGVEMPKAEQLPPSIKRLVSLQASKIRSGFCSHRDTEELIGKLRKEIPCVVQLDRAGLWKRIEHTLDAGELDQFVKTFEGTVEAFAARTRIKQLTALSEIEGMQLQELSWKLDETRGSVFTLNDDGPGVPIIRSLEEVTNGQPLEQIIRFAFSKIDGFLDRWPEGDLARRIFNIRALAREIAECIPEVGWMAIYEAERQYEGKKSWSDKGE